MPRRGAKPFSGIPSRGRAEYRAPLATVPSPLRGGAVPVNRFEDAFTEGF